MINSRSFLQAVALSGAVFVFPHVAGAQELAPASDILQTSQVAAQQTNVPQTAQRAEAAVEGAVRRFRVGVRGGVGLDPELIDFGAHAAFGPIFRPAIEFRPGIEFGIGEVTTMFAVNMDVLYTLPGSTGETRWSPYVGAGPSFGLSHRGFTADDPSKVSTPGTTTTTTDNNRFDFGDTDFNGGFNFIAGARNQRGMFFEMNATAYGVSNVRLLAGFNF